jgi:phage terminase large subunit-like protein
VEPTPAPAKRSTPRCGRGPQKLPECGRTYIPPKGPAVVCHERGPHFCKPRALHAAGFIEELCVHTKGVYRGRRFILAKWQREEIIWPLFGWVRWSDEFGTYVRRYSIAWIEIGRKNGKSELLAAIMLYLLVGEAEPSGELYGVARDIDQAAKIFDVASQMVLLEPLLARRLTVREHNKRIIDRQHNSFYRLIPADAKGELGGNVSGVAADEILAWRDGSMWTALRTGMGSGARLQPLLIAATTAGDDPSGFGAAMHAEMERILEDPDRAPHIFVFMRNMPQDADPFCEDNWYWPNPALGDFLSLDAMRQEALEAANDPMQENGFRQFRCNQWVQQASRWMPMHRYKASAGDVWLTPHAHRDDYAGRTAFCGLDLAAKFDLVSWCLVVPDDDGACDVFWRFWLPEATIPALDKANAGKISGWVRDGWISICEGEVITYDDLYEAIGQDAEHYAIRGGGADRWSMMPVIQEIANRTSLPVDEALMLVDQTYKGMSPGMLELMSLVKQKRFRHHGNPVAAWCFDNVQVRKAPYDPELIRPDKPDRAKTGKRIDAVPAAAMAVDAWKSRGAMEPPRSAYEDADLMVL